MKDKTYKLVCSICKGTNIEQKCWVDANSDEVLYNCSNGDINDNWCRDCGKHVKFDIIELNNLQQPIKAKSSNLIMHLLLDNNYFSKNEIIITDKNIKLKVLETPHKKWWKQLFQYITFGLYKIPTRYKCKVIE